jgi:hypothetical protein
MIVKLIRFAFGQEVVAELVEETDSTVTIKNVLAAVPTPQGSIAFITFAPLLDKEDNQLVINRSHIVYVATPGEDVVKQHRNAFSSVITPEKSLIL